MYVGRVRKRDKRRQKTRERALFVNTEEGAHDRIKKIDCVFFVCAVGPLFLTFFYEIRDVTQKRIRFSSEKNKRARKCAALAINCFDRERTRYTEKALGFSNRA